jgi:hypothetical protein
MPNKRKPAQGNALEYRDIVNLHIEKFGVEPVITGANYAISDQIEDLIIQAIVDGRPYVEEDLPPGIVT